MYPSPTITNSSVANPGQKVADERQHGPNYAVGELLAGRLDGLVSWGRVRFGR